MSVRTEILNTNCGPVSHTVFPIIGDGACLFRTLSYLIFGDQEVKAKFIRAQIVDHVANNWERFSIHSHDSKGDNYSNPSAYSEDMIRDSCYGSACEIYAAAELYNFHFEVYRDRELHSSYGNSQYPIKRLRFTGGLSNGHFDAYNLISEENFIIQDTEVLRISGRLVPHCVVPMKHNADSLFSSIGYLIYEIDCMAVEIREELAGHVVNNFIKFTKISHECNFVISRRSGDYFNKITKLHSNGGYCELVAASELYGYRFEVYRDGNLFLNIGDQNKPIKRLRLLGDISDGHFDVLTLHEKLTISPSPVQIEMSKAVSLSPSQSIIEQSTMVTPLKPKRVVKRRARFTNRVRKNQLRNAAKKHAELNPQSNINAALKYQNSHPFNHLKAVRVYNMKHPEINRRAVRKYTQAVPDVHRLAVAKYTENNPDVNREAVARYSQSHQDDRIVSKRNHQDSNIQKHRESARVHIQEKRDHPWKSKALLGFSYDPNMSYEADEVLKIGAMTHQCEFCSAKKFMDEYPTLCCKNGQVKLPPYDDLPEPLQSLLTDFHPQHKDFMDKIRKYNSCFQMTSFGAREITSSRTWMPTYRVLGQVYHMVGSLIPSSDQEARYLQVYFVGEDQRELDARCSHYPDVNRGLVSVLQKMLHEKNNYIRELRTIIDSLGTDREEFQVVIHGDRVPADSHRGCFNAPTTHEVALVMIGQEFGRRDIVLQSKNNRFRQISEIHRSYDALQYPLMFCYGEDGYKTNIPLLNPNKNFEPKNTMVSAAMFYAYRIMIRANDFNRLSYFRALYSQFLVDMYAKIETERLNYLRHNQKKLRVDKYYNIKDAMMSRDSATANVQNVAAAQPAPAAASATGQNAAQTTANSIGQRVILPSSFTGGARYLHERTQDAMTYVRYYGAPDLFITVTCNPKWPEITAELHSGQKWFDRHDIVARVFNMKVRKLMQLLTKGRVFGEVRCYLYTVEWQKRGLPHVHLLVWLRNKLFSAQIDSIISAEIPDPKVDPELFKLVKAHMVHGPCGNLNPRCVCMVKGNCSKRFPKPFTTDTHVANNGYPSYRRRSVAAGGHVLQINQHQIDNGWIVPYSPVLLRYFNSHINVEYCCDIKAIKYILKYINKGSDKAAISLERELDEIKFFETGRYLSTNEGVWRILEFFIHRHFPSVMHLEVHLENGERVYFNESNIEKRMENPRKTTLLAFFNLCQIDPFARELFYVEVPQYYTFDEKKKKFNRRVQGKNVEGWLGIVKSPALGRIYAVSPNDRECYHLRMLLHVVKGPTSFDALRTVDGVLHSTYHGACNALGLLDGGQHWVTALEEAKIYITPYNMRELFSIMLVHCHLPNPLSLWEKFKYDMADDIIRRHNRDGEENIAQLIMDDILNLCLIHIEDVSLRIGGSELPTYNLPKTIRSASYNINSRIYLRETSYDAIVLANYVTQKQGMLTPDQKTTYDLIIKNIEDKKGKIFFLDAPGGTGKTFLLNLLLAKVRSECKIALATASSGIAATLLDGGRTAHSAFKLPLNLLTNDNPNCSISKQSDLAHVLLDCKLIVWDEATMMHKAGFEALDRCLKDIRNNNEVMGGLTVLLAGDFRQTLPVIPRGTRADEVEACFKKSMLWRSVTKIALKENMRVKLGNNNHESAGAFAELLLNIGNGKFQNQNGLITIPETLGTVVKTIDDLIAKIYPNIKDIQQKSINWFCERAILCPTNARVNSINDYLMQSFQGEEIMYTSVDSVTHDNESMQYPVEFLNSQNPPGIPAQKLYLKVGTPIMLLRNIHPPRLCNGTRLQVKALKRQIIEATILTGFAQGETVVIPRMPLEPSDYPIHFKRLQFPVKVCFAMTINKSQGQSLKTAGIDLRENCFSHGQLYVGCSRVSSPKDLFLLTSDGKTVNVVYPEVL